MASLLGAGFGVKLKEFDPRGNRISYGLREVFARSVSDEVI